MSRSDFSENVLEILRARCGGACEGCGRVGVRLEAHHRKFRSRGGGNGAANGLMLCGAGNASGCHGRAHSGAGVDLGWAVAAGDEPEERWVWVARWGFPVRFTDSGLVLRAQSEACLWHRRQGVQVGCSVCRFAGSVVWEFSAERGWFL